MKLYKFLSVALSIMMLATMLVACQTETTTSESSKSEASQSEESQSSESSQEEDDNLFNMDGDIQLNEPGEFPLVIGEPATISVFTPYVVEMNSLLYREDNSATRWYEDYTNIRIDWTIVSPSDKKAKLNLLFQSDSYEDIIMSSFWNGATQYAYAKEGYLIPLNEYLESDDAYWRTKYVEEMIDVKGDQIQDYINELIMPDGNIYSLCQLDFAFHTEVQTRMYVYQPWLDTLGLETPTTTEEYYEVLKAFKEQDPNGNGKNDEIPLSGSYDDGWNMNPFEFLMNSFVYFDDTTKTFVDDGQMQLSYLQDSFKDGTEYMAKLYSEGLLDSEVFTQDDMMVKGKATQDIQLVGSVAGASWDQFSNAKANVPGDWTNFVALAPLEGPDGVQYAKHTQPKPKVRGHITSNCETPKLAFRMLDSFYNIEVGMNVYAGISDEYDFFEILPEDTDIMGINGEKAKYRNMNYTSVPNCKWSQIGPGASKGVDWHSYQALQADVPELDIEYKLYQAAKSYYPYIPEPGLIPPSLIFEEDDAAVVVDYETTLESYFDEQFASMITNNNTAENWDAFIEGAEARGSNELLALYQTSYEERMAVMHG